MMDTARMRPAIDQQALDAAERAAPALPARPGDPQGVRSPVRRRRDSSEQRRADVKPELRPDPKPEQKPDQKKESSEIVSAATGLNGVKESGNRPARTSIAANPRVTYPAVAPYSGQISAQRAATHPDPPDTARPGDTWDTPGAAMTTSESGNKSKGQGKRVSKSKFSQQELEEDPLLGEGAAWPWVALVIALLVLIAVFVAWRLGWFGGTNQLRGALVRPAPLSAKAPLAELLTQLWLY